MSSLNNRLKKLEQKRGIALDMNKPMSEWSRAELITYVKSVNSEYDPPDMSKLSRDELRDIVYGSA